MRTEVFAKAVRVAAAVSLVVEPVSDANALAAPATSLLVIERREQGSEKRLAGGNPGDVRRRGIAAKRWSRSTSPVSAAAAGALGQLPRGVGPHPPPHVAQGRLLAVLFPR
mmetsp:Transcript_17301/g.29820  ORF Transcript_17301/g.29820 Transcript_17301/m.29820 type:complete len:111 (-) Transcript_17301:655-987(-)